MAKKVLSGKDNTNGFQKNPQNINKNGAPRKSFSSINLSLKEKGVEPLSKMQFIEAYTLIFNATDKELKEISRDTTVPYVFRLIIQELSNTKTRSKALADYRDYMFGRAEQKRELTISPKLEPIEFTIIKNKD